MIFRIALLMLLPLIGIAQNKTTTQECTTCKVPEISEVENVSFNKDTIFIIDTLIIRDTLNNLDTIIKLDTIFREKELCVNQIEKPEFSINVGYYNHPTFEPYFRWKEYNTGITIQYINNSCSTICGITGVIDYTPFVDRYWKINNLFVAGARIEWNDNFILSTPVGYSGDRLKVMLSPRYLGKEIEFGLMIYWNINFKR